MPAHLPPIVHYAKIYVRLLLLKLRAQLEYEADFWLGIAALLILQVANFTLIWAVFRQAPTVGGWSMWEVALLYALLIIPRCLTDLFCLGVWLLPAQIYRGILDVMLVRPMPTVLQIFASASSIHGLGHLALGTVLIVEASLHLHIVWTFERCLLFIYILVNSFVITGGTLLAGSMAAFWTRYASNGLPDAIPLLSDMAQMPLDIYGRGIRSLLTYVVPFAFVSYFPACLLLQRPIQPHWMLWLFPFSGPAVVVVVLFLWRRGLARYESAGN